ncbi:CDP-alcohol phosphatidyltransferase family protein [Fusobacterium simiae]|uniref:CDP-alcohol phosphatidyltransferase family protein n=1 Tax=Fusobacterium simiae TaxID=855 RepID=A0ABT4DGQ9_FUSSI|nr:CDP-alcohol phosphatidyltransferase family protein [Fusobacterium simiae]MCY7007794.1 CDP-alcohol phosphatidyltransferase family protein [Fusobacterium simiae]
MDISIYKLKTKFQNLLMPICKKLVDLKVTPNQITVTTVLLNIIFAGIIYKFGNLTYLFLIVPVFLFLRMALNALDGMIANKFNQKTKMGVFYNEAGDVVSDTVFFYVFLRVIGINEIYNLLFVFLSVLSEYVGVVAVMVDNKRHYEGPMGKSDRAFLISLLAITYFFIGNKYFDYILILAIVLLIFTIYNRISSSLKGE